MSSENTGKLIIFSAPSGAGKTTIVKHLLKQGLGLEFSISACTREQRLNEIDGKDYYFLTVEEFKNKIENNEFLEWEEVYNNQYYGTLRSEVKRIWDRGNHVIFDVDVIGGLNIKKEYGDKALAIFVKAPSVEQLENRLKQRDSETTTSLERRLEKAESEIKYEPDFDCTILNENLESALSEGEKIVKEFLNSQ